MAKLSEQVVAADASEQRELLEAAFARIHKISLAPDDWSALHWSYVDHFKSMLNAEAYESAALMLVPDKLTEWEISRSTRDPRFGQYQARICLLTAEQDPEELGPQSIVNSATPALAIAAAALKTRGL